MSDFCVLTGFENVASMIELDQSSLSCTDAKHRTQNWKQFHSTTNDCRKVCYLRNIML